MSTSIKTILGILAVIVIITGGIFLYNQNSIKNNSIANTISQAPTKKVNITYLPLSTVLPLWVAKEKGFFIQNNVDVELSELATSNLNAEAVQSGTSDLNYYTTATAGLLANEKDPNKVLIYSGNVSNKDINWDGIFAKTTSGINNIKELAGKKIGVFLGSSATTYLKNFLKSKSVDVSNIEFVELPPANQKNSLDQGAIDALFAYEPSVTILSKSPDYKKIQSNILYENPDAVIAIATINREFVRSYPELAKRVVKSIDQGIDYFRSNPKESRELITKYIKMNPIIAQEHTIYNQGKSTEIDVIKTQKYFDYLQEIGEIKQKVNASELVYKP